MWMCHFLSCSMNKEHALIFSIICLVFNALCSPSVVFVANSMPIILAVCMLALDHCYCMVMDVAMENMHTQKDVVRLCSMSTLGIQLAARQMAVYIFHAKYMNPYTRSYQYCARLCNRCPVLCRILIPKCMIKMIFRKIYLIHSYTVLSILSSNCNSVCEKTLRQTTAFIDNSNVSVSVSGCRSGRDK